MNNTASGFAIYDGHGKRVATLTKSGSSFSLTDLRSYDAWGNVLGQNPTGRPRGRYVANLGHVQDDESGLVYMRARYYEPTSGRFVSEDPAMSGTNWYSYCGSDPVNYKDQSGKWRIGDYEIRIDWDINPQFGDLHVWENGKEIISMFGDGFAHHKKAANVFTEDFIRTIVKAAQSGHPQAVHLLNALREGWFGFNARRVAGVALGGLSYTTVDAYMKQDPEGFIDIMRTIYGDT